MEFISECSAVSQFPIEVSFSCFFHIQREYCCLAAAEKRLYKKNDNDLNILDIPRSYHKLLYWDDRSAFLAYTHFKNKNEIIVYHLDYNLREFDIQNLRTECTADVEDMWLDSARQLLYFVYPSSIQKYNLNGDYLGFIMKAPIHTQYRAFCSDENFLFVAYERQGCAYVAQYDGHGVYLSKFNIGENFLFGNMEIVHSEIGVCLNIYGKRRGCIVVCLELSIEKIICSNVKKNIEENNKIQVELSKGNGVGGLTCFLSCPEE